MLKGIVTDVFFDLDHTLWDFERNSALTFKKILNGFGLKIDLERFLQAYAPINQEYWRLYREEKVSQAELRYQRLRKTFDAIDIRVEHSTINMLSQAYIEHLSSFNHVFPGTIDILEYLKPNYKLHIITNGFQEIQQKKLKNANIDTYFVHIINSEMAGVKKPNPHIFQLALQLANVKPGNALMIGDNLEADILGAQSAGFHTLHFNPEGHPAHGFCKMILSLNEIKTVL
ncbi:MAG: YjjG family noncanonical pyrimidine nucleotidase [Bacteroidota bacterium]